MNKDKYIKAVNKFIEETGTKDFLISFKVNGRARVYYLGDDITMFGLIYYSENAIKLGSSNKKVKTFG